VAVTSTFNERYAFALRLVAGAVEGGRAVEDAAASIASPGFARSAKGLIDWARQHFPDVARELIDQSICTCGPVRHMVGPGRHDTRCPAYREVPPVPPSQRVSDEAWPLPAEKKPYTRPEITELDRGSPRVVAARLVPTDVVQEEVDHAKSGG
jgi:hypothetical protein